MAIGPILAQVPEAVVYAKGPVDLLKVPDALPMVSGT